MVFNIISSKMWVILILVVAVGATTPIRPGCPGPNAPPDCGPYGSFVVCPGKCQRQNCSSLWSKFRCDDDGGCAIPTCICDEGYLKDDQTGKCITVQECMNPIRCGPKEVKVKCKTICPPQSCNISYTDYSCNSTFPCEEGCDCIKDYLRDENGNCVLNDKCPPLPVVTENPEEPSLPPGVKCGANETYSDCTFGCPQDFCPTDDDLGTILCKPPRDCPDGCRCKDNYKWKSFDERTCILASDCPKKTKKRIKKT